MSSPVANMNWPTTSMCIIVTLNCRLAALQEITELTERLSGSRNKAERALRDSICDGVLPGLLDSVAARKRASERLAAIEAAPRKRSSRLQVSNGKQHGILSLLFSVSQHRACGPAAV